MTLSAKKRCDLKCQVYFGKDPPEHSSLQKENQVSVMAKKKEALKNKLTAKFNFRLKEILED